ncbi:MAG: TonB-dependent receptor plug domain-containing protein [Spirochaetales bacterium]|nr:TonB-dependent receptor plug domain-containing protein [Leptospiraceae bacterium]MCP5479843.1 TonB-dependent receptor plug domain-containing protein [Spirochaetales bacterium]MCP5486233.1 TonB-dependent receptor plug domain-containing protein [Spirochaetales bacterium]
MRVRSNRCISLCVLLAAFLGAPGFARAEVNFTGRLLERPGGPPMVDVRVVLLDLRQGAYTDESGRFRFSVSEPGYFTLRFVAGDRVEERRVEVRFDGEEVLCYMETEALPEPEGVRVIGLRDRTRLSRFRLSQDEIRRLPGVYGDSLRAITTLPGITPVPPVGALPTTNILTTSFLAGFGIGPPYSNSASSGVLVIRGAGPRSSQVLLDGFKVQYPFHLGDQSSVINNEYIRTVDVYTGTYPARFGNSTGGIISIEGPQAVEKPHGHLNVSLFLSDAYYELPIFEGAGYFIGSVRKSYPNYALLTLYPDGIPPNAKYADYLDGQYKLGFQITRNHEFSFLYFGSRDILDYSQEVDELSNGGSSNAIDLNLDLNARLDGNSNQEGRPPVGLDRGFHTQGMNYTFRHEGFLENRLYAQVSRFREDFDLDFRSPLTGETVFGYEVLDARREFQVRDELTFELIEDAVAVNAGYEHNDVRWELSLRNFSPQQSTNPNTPNFVEVINDLIESNRTFRSLYDGDRTSYDLDAGYGELEIQFWRLRLTPGVRVERYSLSGSTGIGPRGGMELEIPESGTVLLAGAGRHFSVPPGLNLISIEAGNPYLHMEESDHMAAGIEQKLGSEWLVKIEFYRNIFRNLVVEDAFLVIPYSLRTNRRELVTKTADILADPFENRPLNFSNDGTGWSEGFEIFVKKTREPSASGFFGWVSYSLTLSKRNNHQPRLSESERDALRNRNLNREVVSYLEFGRNMLLYYDTGETEFFYDNDREELYDLDRTHQVNMVVNYKFSPEWQLGLKWKYATNVPFTPIVGNQDQPPLEILGRPTFLPRYSDYYNSDRLHPVHQLDLRIDRFFNYSWGYANYYVELINVYARRNPEQENFDFLYPYSRGSNPSIQYESNFIETPAGGGRQWLLPLVNFGLEVSF